MSSPFDPALPSPIAAVLELRSSGEGAVVSAGRSSDAQRTVYLRTALEDSLIAHLRGDRRRELVIISGSAGGGKSAEIDLLLREGIVAAENVIEDATHSDTPREDQVEKLARFLEPFMDGSQPHPAAAPRVIALNTGMAIRFFDRARDRGFRELERLFKVRIGLERQVAASPLEQRLLVLNLDERPTTGMPGSLFQRMLAAFDPDQPNGVLRGAERCGTCTVREFCFVRTNAAIVSTETAKAALDGLVHHAALRRGRDLPPRALWDVATDFVTGGEPFSQTDPCDRIVEIANSNDTGVVWRRLACNGAFIPETRDEPSRLGDLAREIQSHDPSLRADRAVHDILAGAGIQPEEDAAQLTGWLSAPEAEAVATAAVALRSGSVRPAPGRGLVRASFLAGQPSGQRDGQGFREALAEYAVYSGAPGDFPALTRLRDVAAAGLVNGFGATARGEGFLPSDTRAGARDVRLFVQADLHDPRVLDVLPDPVMSVDAEGATILGYRPLRIVLTIRKKHDVLVTLPLFELLVSLATGVTHAGAELERFEALRRAVERAARRDVEVPLLIALADGRRFKLARRPALGGQPLTVLEEVS